MLPNWVAGLPPWLLVGLALGVVASVGVAAVFVVGERLFPGVERERAGRVDGSERRRGEIRAYLREIGEPYAEGYEIEGRRVAFYLLHRDVAITFDAQAYFRLESAGVTAVLCEHEMPGWTLGRRLPFETPTVDGGAAAPDPVASAFAELELDPGADVDAVRDAYRDRVKEVHPDQGGDEESFKRVREAYATARSHAD
ncbi:MAG: J domain-containing protein [Haloferacaceae archaeon]